MTKKSFLIAFGKPQNYKEIRGARWLLMRTIESCMQTTTLLSLYIHMCEEISWKKEILTRPAEEEGKRIFYKDSFRSLTQPRQESKLF
jgi:hypothetical protein